MSNQEIREIMEKQLQLLSEESTRAVNSYDTADALQRLTAAMLSVAAYLNAGIRDKSGT